MDHCIARIIELIGRPEPDARVMLQLGYNLGRLSELTGLGRGPFWDAWKEPILAWDRPTLARLARDLPIVCDVRPSLPPQSD